jgi:mono/diheme cytochrome c family protein
LADSLASPQPTALLQFVGRAARPQPLTKQELEATVAAELVVGWDPYYQHQKRFRALPLHKVLALGFPQSDLRSDDLVLRASDGYSVPMRAAQLLDPAAYLAIADLDRPEWEPIGPQAASPAPFYLIWKGEGRSDLTSYPRPWGLVTVERARFEALYPHTAPPAAERTPSIDQGYAIFRRECIRCHAINREGGRVGPELNVPQSIVEYRPLAQLRDYIRNPLRFRYGSMPAHPDLTDGDLDGLIDYFQLMRQHKFDPATTPAPTTNVIKRTP